MWDRQIHGGRLVTAYNFVDGKQTSGHNFKIKKGVMMKKVLSAFAVFVMSTSAFASEEILQSGLFFYKAKDVSQSGKNQNCFEGPIELLSVNDQDLQKNSRLLPVVPGFYEFKNCNPVAEVPLSQPFFISEGVSITSIRSFDKFGWANVGILSANIDRIPIAGFEFKISSPEIKFSAIPYYSSEFSVEEFEIKRQKINFHYNWTDTTVGSTTPKPLDVSVTVEGLVSLFGVQPSLTTIVEYNPDMRWEGNWINGTNTYVGIPWKKVPNARESKKFKYCLVAIGFGSGLGGQRDPNISAFGLSPSFADTAENAKRYCGNDLTTMHAIYQRALPPVHE